MQFNVPLYNLCGVDMFPLGVTVILKTHKNVDHPPKEKKNPLFGVSQQMEQTRYYAMPDKSVVLE